MKNRKKLLSLTLGLAFAMVGLASCGGGNSTVHTVTFYKGNSVLKTEEVTHGKKCPEYTPAELAGFDFMGWYAERSHTGAAFDFNTAIKEDLDLFAWYKAQFAVEERTFYLVGNAEGLDWNGETGAAVGTSPLLVLNEDELENEHNVFEIEYDFQSNIKFRIMVSTDGETSDGWTDDYGYGMIKELINSDPDSDTELVLGTNVKEMDSKNIGILVPGHYKITLDLQDTTTVSGGMTLELLREDVLVLPTVVGLIGLNNNWDTDIDLTSTDGGETWEIDYDIAENAVFKLRANHDWNNGDWGFGAITNAPEGAFEADGDSGNIKCKVAGTYHFLFNVRASSIEITEVV